MIATEEIGGVEFSLERYQRAVIASVGFAYAVVFTHVERIDVNFAGVERLHCGEKPIDPIQIDGTFAWGFPEAQNLKVVRVAA